ncbi:hypothetical protein BaRGS_00002776, partial [Batillaria attramentaria]
MGFLESTLKISVVLLIFVRVSFCLEEGCSTCWASPEYCARVRFGCQWYFDTSRLTELGLEANCSQPDLTYVVDPPENTTKPSGSSQCSGFHLSSVSEQRCLTAFPSNICSFPNIRAVTITDTSLAVFPNLTCKTRLGFLDLSRNNLTYVPRGAFVGLEMLQEVRLDHNQITYIHPEAFDLSLPNLNVFSITHNKLVSIDPWVSGIQHRFCKIDLSFNLIEDITNEGNRTIEPSLNYGPGFVDLTHNRFVKSPTEFLKKHKLFLKPTKLWAKFIHWGFDFRFNPFHCDCKFYDMAVWISRLRVVMWRDYFNITCASPEIFSGLPVMNLPAENLTCDVTKNCPEQCSCLQRPSKRDTLVNCEGRGLSVFPEIMPEGRLTLSLANNSLDRVPPMDFFTRTLAADFTSNKIAVIDVEVPRRMKNVHRLDLRNNELRYLPDTLQLLSSDDVLLDLNTLSCTCNLTWFPLWVQQARSTRYTHMTCITSRGDSLMLLNATDADLGCGLEERDTSAYKLTLITKYHRFDVFLSSASGEADAVWITNRLLPLLDDAGISRCYWPFRDCLPGSVEMEEVTKCLQDSASALVILSSDYTASSACLFQFSQAYNRMMAHGQGRLLLLHQGSVNRKCIPDRRLRAMLTLRMSYEASHLGDLLKVVKNPTAHAGNLPTQADDAPKATMLKKESSNHTKYASLSFPGASQVDVYPAEHISDFWEYYEVNGSLDDSSVMAFPDDNLYVFEYTVLEQGVDLAKYKADIKALGEEYIYTENVMQPRIFHVTAMMPFK